LSKIEERSGAFRFERRSEEEDEKSTSSCTLCYGKKKSISKDNLSLFEAAGRRLL
jgi:hypothetical protein